MHRAAWYNEMELFLVLQHTEELTQNYYTTTHKIQAICILPNLNLYLFQVGIPMIPLSPNSPDNNK